MQRTTITAAVIMLISAAVFASTSPKEVIQTSIQSMTQELTEHKDKVQTDNRFLKNLIHRVIFPHVDFNHMNQVALGQYYDEAINTNKLAPFSDALKNNIFNVYDIAFKSYDGEKINITKVKLQKESDIKVGHLRIAIVESEILTKNSAPIQVDYIMHETQQGWKVYDIRVDKVGFLQSFSSSIKSSIRRKGLENTIKVLNEM